MRAVVQRVTHSKVEVDQAIVGEIEQGVCVLLGIGDEDTMEDVKYMADKIINLRIFEDNEGKMNLSLLDIGGKILAISQFTLFGDCRKGKRPSFIKAAKPDVANDLYEKFIEVNKEKGVKIEKGKFQADMMVTILNDGPVTLLIDSKKEF